VTKGATALSASRREITTSMVWMDIGHGRVNDRIDVFIHTPLEGMVNSTGYDADVTLITS